jgi:hypothetical protein
VVFLSWWYIPARKVYSPVGISSVIMLQKSIFPNCGITQLAMVITHNTLLQKVVTKEYNQSKTLVHI